MEASCASGVASSASARHIADRRAAARRSQLRVIASALFILGWFLFFSRHRFQSAFADDDYMNMAIYFGRGPWRMLAAQFLLWQDTTRPMAAAFYLPLHHWFGLNPLPFQAALMAVIAANTLLVYLLARYLGAPKLAAGLAALVACYHPGLASLNYNVDNVYDVLCFLFSFSVLAYYIRIRRTGRLLGIGEIFVAMALYLCALNSKEMAIVLPVLLIAYELIYRPAPGIGGGVWPWVRGPALVAVSMAALNSVYLFGKLFAAGALGKQAAYHPVFSLERAIAFQKGSLEELLCRRGEVEVAGVAAIWAILTILAWRRDSPLLKFCWVAFLVAALPIEFLEHRLQGCLYIPMAFMAIFVGAVLVESAWALAGASPASWRGIVFGVLIGLAVLLWGRETQFRNEVYVRPGASRQGLRAREIVRQLGEIHATVKPHSRVVFVNDPFEGYDMAFIGELWFADRTVQVQLQNKMRMPETELAKADALFTFRDGKMVRTK
jgi:hypothetical protein